MTRAWVWWTLAAVGAGALAAAVVESVRASGGGEYTNAYKGFTIRSVCGGLGPGCWAGWRVSAGGQSYTESVGDKSWNAAQALAAAQARIDSYDGTVTPA